MMMLRHQRRTILNIVKFIAGCTLIFVVIQLSVTRAGDGNRPIPTSGDVDKLMIEADLDNAKRLSSVEETCRKYNLGVYRVDGNASIFKHPPAPQYTVFYIDRLHNVSYCPIYKAGSTTWIYNLCLLMNVPESELNSGKEQLSTIARRVLPEIEFPESQKALDVTKKLLVVRHPFERLLSAYRDKLENSVAGREHGTFHFYRKYGSKIVQKYRGKDFIKPRNDQVIEREGVPPPAGVEPTFREFVRYLINTDIASYGDDHWMPYYLFCTPCIVRYDIIAKVETLWRDQIYAIHKLGLEKKIQPRWRHSIGHSNASRIYFSQLDKDMARKLYDKYKLDFDLFDYSPEPYYEYASSA